MNYAKIKTQVKTKLKLTPNAKVVLAKRFLKKDSSGTVIETPEDMFERVAKTLALAESNYPKGPSVNESKEQFYEILSNLKFLSGTPMRNAGRKTQLLSACVVMPLEDSLESIFKILMQQALVQRLGTPVGYDFSRLRPEGDIVFTTGKSSSGPISFMRLLDFCSEVILNVGSARYSAHMGVLRVDHPDIYKFITAKKDYTQLNNFNISVAITDKFMEAVRLNQDFELINPRDGKVWQKVKATDLFHKIAISAHKSAEPGVLFIDEINRHNPTPAVGKLEAVNLCGEQPLLPYEACTLGSLVLPNFLKKQNGDFKIEWEELKRVIKIAVRFLDNSIDINKYPVEEMAEINLNNRRIGLGIMGFADVLARLGIPYNSKEALMFAEKLMKFVTDQARKQSVQLARERGSFPNFYKSIWPKRGFGELRNCAVTTIAPTGTISLVASVTGGIEPFFALAFIRKHMGTMEGAELFEVNSIFKEVAEERGFYSEDLIDGIVKTGTIEDIKVIPKDIKKVFVTAHDIKPMWHIKMQAAFQKHTDNAITKTVNMPNKATVEDVKNVYKLAHELKCKGVTVYRDRSRDKQVLNIGKK